MGLNFIERILFKLIDRRYEKGKVLFLDDVTDLTGELKDNDKLWSIISKQENEIDRLNKEIMKLQYEIDSPMVMLNEIRKERLARGL